jgi:hypothetical protein
MALAKAVSCCSLLHKLACHWHYVFCWRWLNFREGCNSVVCHVVLRDREIGDARHVPGTSIVLQRRYAFYSLRFSFETYQPDSFTVKHSSLTSKVPVSIPRAGTNTIKIVDLLISILLTHNLHILLVSTSRSSPVVSWASHSRCTRMSL